MVRTEAGALRPLWRGVYEGVGRGLARALTLGVPGASAYLASNVASGDPAYGLSDIDLVIVAPDAGRPRRRWTRLRRAVPPLAEVFPDLATYTPLELHAAADSTTLTHGSGALYLGPAWARDERGLRERPGLTGPAGDWRKLHGAERRAPVLAPARHEMQIAAWLELQFWWREAMRTDLLPDHPHFAYLAFKLVAQAARAWLLVERGERTDGREDALRRALARAPEEEQALRRALVLRGELYRPHPEAWEELLPAFARLSGRVAARLVAEAQAAGAVEVRVRGIPREGVLPLVDWRGLVLGERLDDVLVPAPGDPGSPSVLAAAVKSAVTPGRYAGLRGHGLLVLAAPGPWTRGFLRGVACPTSDPVSFAVLDRLDIARFPSLPGWSATDVVRRALAEHGAWLAHADENGSLADRKWLSGPPAGRVLTAARAALLAESLADGAPELALGPEAIAAALTERLPACQAAAEEVGSACAAGVTPASEAVRELRRTVGGLASYTTSPERVTV